MRDHLVLYVNGERHQARYDDAVMTLADFLRRRLGLVGTKIVCNEGDCGACSVLIGRASGTQDKLEYLPVDACITFLFQLDRTHVVTVEGLGGACEAAFQENRLTPVQDAMIRCHGSQCGFCTPGFVVAVHGMIQQGQPLSDASLRYGLSGNLCRCTGYQQILDAAKSVDCESAGTLADGYDEQPMLADFRDRRDTIRLCGDHRISIPLSLEDAVRFKASFPNAIIVSGATDYGVLRNHGRLGRSDLLCLSSIEGYNHIAIERGRLKIGGGATWTAIEKAVESLFPPYHAILTRFGSPQIRNFGTLAGNLAGGSPIADAIPFHLVMDSHLDLISVDGVRQVSLNDFYTGYRQTVMADNELIAAIGTPLLQDDQRLVLYKISKRKDMDIATLTFALWVQLSGQHIGAARFALGGVGPTVQRIADVEDFLAGKEMSLPTSQAAGAIARDQITPWSDVRGGADFRLQLAENLMSKAYYEIVQQNVTV